jgi:lysophospholipase L1-like esterase
MSLLRIILVLGALLGAVLIIQSSILVWRINKGIQIARNSHPFEKRMSNALVRVLVVGDSTGVGTGASRPLDSVAGRLSQDFPQAEIINRAVNGAHVVDVITQLGFCENERFDLVIVQVGGNDILRFTDLQLLRDGIATLLDAASQEGGRVIFLSTGNVGLAPAFFAPLSSIYTWRTRKVRELFMNAAAHQGIEYVDLFQEKDKDPFLKNPNLCYAPDFLHPGSEGYRLWYKEVKNQTSLVAFMQGKLSQ